MCQHEKIDKESLLKQNQELKRHNKMLMTQNIALRKYIEAYDKVVSSVMRWAY